MATNYYRLATAIKNSNRALRPFRENRREMVRDYCGPMYGMQDEHRRPDYLQLFNQAADTYTQVLAASRPRVLVSTHFQELRWFANHFGRALNNLIEEIKLDFELRMAVLEAFFVGGPFKVYYADDVPRLIEGTDVWVDPGKPYAESMNLDNFGFDARASSWKKRQYSWDEYEVPVKDLLRDVRNKNARDAIKAARQVSVESGEESTTTLTDPNYCDDDHSYLPLVRVRDIWVPSENSVVTMLASSDKAEGSFGDFVLRELEWEGPENGPHYWLSFSDTPGNVIGVSPGMKLMKLSSLANSLYRKQVNQARRQRDLPIFEASAEDDVHRLDRAADGEWTRVANREAVDILKLGGVDAGNQQFSMAVLEQFDRMAGNLQLMAGLSAGSDTLGQDQILQSQASKLQEKMQQRVVEFTSEICRDLGWLLWNDQSKTIRTEHVIPGLNRRVNTTWTPELREGNFLQYNFSIEPFSMQYKSPSQRAGALLSFVTNIALPMYQLMAQQGGMINLKELTKVYAELNDLPRLNDIVAFSGQPDPNAVQPEPAPRSANTIRQHVRQNYSGGPAQQSGEMQQQLAQLAQVQARANG